MMSKFDHQDLSYMLVHWGVDGCLGDTYDSMFSFDGIVYNLVAESICCMAWCDCDFGWMR